MAFQEVLSLDADTIITLGGVNKETGRKNPTTAEGYYLGLRTVEGKRGPSKIHFLRTPKGNLGVWGKTNMNSQLSAIPTGTMVRITSTGTKPTKNGDMYTFKVEFDSSEKIDVPSFKSNLNDSENTGVTSYADEDADNSYDSDDSNDSFLSASNDGGYVRAAVTKSSVDEVRNLLKSKKQ